MKEIWTPTSKAFSRKEEGGAGEEERLEGDLRKSLRDKEIGDRLGVGEGEDARAQVFIGELRARSEFPKKGKGRSEIESVQRL